MGYSTTYLGRLDIEPALNAAEIEWLRAFTCTDRVLHPDDPYAVPMNPGAECLTEPPVARPDDAQPPFATTVEALARCDWLPCVEGCCLSWDGIEKSRAGVIEVQYLIDHFLRPEAHAAADGRADFEHFTFDHHVCGVVAAERSDTRELFLLVAEDNTVAVRTLVAGDPCW